MAIITEINANNIQYLYKRSELTAKQVSNKNTNETINNSNNSSNTELPKDELILSVEAKQIAARQKSLSIAVQEPKNSNSKLEEESNL